MRGGRRRRHLVVAFLTLIILPWSTWAQTPDAQPAASGSERTATELDKLIDRVVTTLGPMLTGERKYHADAALAYQALANAVRQQGERAVPSLIAAVKAELKANNYLLSAKFMVLLGHVRGETSGSFLKDLGVSSENGWVRTAALRSYALSRDEGVVEVLIKALRGDPGIVDRNGLIYDLGKQKDAAAIPFLTDLLSRGNVSERAFAATALGDIGDVEALKPLKRVIVEDRIVPVRANAILAIGQIGRKGSVNYLTRLIGVGRDAREEVAAVAAIGLIAGPEALDALSKVVAAGKASVAAKARAQEEISRLNGRATIKR